MCLLVKCREETESRKEAVGSFGIAEDHMVHGDLKLYWLRFQYNKWQCGFSFIKQYFQIQLLPTLGVLSICWFTVRWIRHLKYIKICTSNTCKGKVSGHVNESLRRETFSFCQGQMNVWRVQ